MKDKNMWREFATVNNLNQDEFFNEVVDCAQAVLAMKLQEKGLNHVNIYTDQFDVPYKLTFEINGACND